MTPVETYRRRMDAYAQAIIASGFAHENVVASAAAYIDLVDARVEKWAREQGHKQDRVVDRLPGG